MRTHRGERPYTCDDCSRSFTTRSALVTHYRIHTGERPYQCPECGKAFPTSSYLLVHRRSHSVEKPFQCELCGKYFKSRELVKKHQVSHTDRKFECGECKKTFKQKKSYKHHSKIGCRVDKEFRWVHEFFVWVWSFRGSEIFVQGVILSEQYISLFYLNILYLGYFLYVCVKWMREYCLSACFILKITVIDFDEMLCQWFTLKAAGQV
jgi:DNA-directed RNA polymerase subunit RPC12/RpoP